MPTNLSPLKYFDSLYPPTTRKAEIQKLIPFLEQGLSSQLIGLPGSGKSNIFRLLAFNKDVRFENFGEYEKHLHFVYIDCSEIKGKPLFDITKFILISLSFSLAERRMIEDAKSINELLNEGLVANDEMLLFQSLKKALDFLSIEKKLTIHLMFDKFDMLLSNITSHFFTNLRILRNHAKYRFGSIFSLTRPLEESLDPILLTDFYDLIAGNHIYLSLFDHVGMDFRLSYIQKAARQTIDDKLRKQMLTLTGGHAQLSKLSFEAIVGTPEPLDDLEQFLLSRTPIQGTLFSIWNAFFPQERTFLLNSPTIEVAKESYPYLVNSGVISEEGITIPLLATFITNAPLEESERVSYDEGKNEVFVGSTPLSDQLSPTEFRLLKFMAQNKEKLLQKDEIIQNVWGDQKSQDGVTDQALDQVFYRLRKRIEKDPTNPKHIQTIKGKGYKLSD